MSKSISGITEQDRQTLTCLCHIKLHFKPIFTCGNPSQAPCFITLLLVIMENITGSYLVLYTSKRAFALLQVIARLAHRAIISFAKMI